LQGILDTILDLEYFEHIRLDFGVLVALIFSSEQQVLEILLPDQPSSENPQEIGGLSRLIVAAEQEIGQSRVEKGHQPALLHLRLV
jgi:hypothetical protein